MSYIIGFFRFWYDFLIGDSWQVAVGVALVTVVTRLLITSMPQLAPVAGPGFFLAMLAVFCSVVLNEQKKPPPRR
jgi:hypothetical protein